jgi:hypothetical protein
MNNENKELEFKVTDLPTEIQDLYINARTEYKEIIESVGEIISTLKIPIVLDGFILLFIC